MKQNQADRAWQRLIAAARQSEEFHPTTAPYGFSTRVAALAAERPKASSLLLTVDRLAWKALVFSGLIMAIGILSSITSTTTSAQDDDSGAQDIVTEIINQA